MPTSDVRLRKKRHAIRRARERYDTLLTLEDIGAFNVIIRLGLGRKIQKGKKGAIKYFIKSLGGIELAAVYDGRINSIVTFLPLEAKEVQRALEKRIK